MTISDQPAPLWQDGPNPEADRKARLKASAPYLDMLKALQNETEAFYRAFPPLRAAIDRVDQLADPQPDEIIAIAENELTLDSLAPLIRFEAERYALHPLYASPVAALNTGAVTGWSLINHPRFLVMLLAFDAATFRAQKAAGKITDVINFQAGDISLRLLQSDGFTCSHWTAPEIRDEAGARDDMTCHFAGRKTYRSGERIFTRGGSETIVYEDIRSATIGIQVYSRVHRTNVIADYDPATHRLKSLSAADQRSSRMQLLSTILRIFEREDGLPHMLTLLDHPDHFVRWQVAREITALSAEIGGPALGHLAHGDCNPLVRRAARRTLDQFYS